MSSKRHSILPSASQSGPKPPVHLSSSLTIADSAVLTGTHQITVHGESVIHPRARLDSHAGRVTIGRRCVVHERATIGSSSSGLASARSSAVLSSARSSMASPGVLSPTAAVAGSGGEAASQSTTAQAVTLGDYVTVEVGAVIEAGGTVVGDGTVVGVGARVGAGAVLGKRDLRHENHCTLTPQSAVPPGDVVPDFTVVYANGMRRTDRRGMVELKNKGLARQIEVLRRLIPSNPAKFA
ncbi:hypothetical protein VTJ49DRAFT_5072 [Mycothermus thermophilus]|uniref:Dynactin subunit 6 n=1 Tax=Humicola insolens TaxID=85995 RepID=A0ABR3V3Z7_HUMIN